MQYRWFDQGAAGDPGGQPGRPGHYGKRDGVQEGREVRRVATRGLRESAPKYSFSRGPLLTHALRMMRP